ncbi:hypothetical protein PWG14_25150 [Chromobacterium amazonense]|uniref:DUF4376 domain-containing protein n=1 Tax=Chromobacterium amazonense TaxID=1382803 RepID=UPI00237E0470|nr:hypothetical protein [Chromobacterium amazonense]MDE1715758.1 hypothetical protein [Chromobacterium amazonense]
MTEIAEQTVYSYSSQTGEYAGETTAMRSPLDEGEVYLIPAWAAETPPPATAANQAAVFRADDGSVPSHCLHGGSWQIVPDWRATPLWSKTTAQPVTAQLGDTPDSLGATPIQPPPFGVWSNGSWSVGPGALAAAQQSQLQMLQAACGSAITAGFTSSALGKPNYYGSLQTDQLNLQTQFAASLSGSPPSTYSIYCSPTPVQNPPLVQHTQAQMLQVLADLNAWRTAQQQKYDALVKQVQGAKTVADVQAVVWK